MGSRTVIRWAPSTDEIELLTVGGNHDQRTKKPRRNITPLFFAAALALTFSVAAARADAQFRLEASLCFLESPLPTAFAEAGWQLTAGNLRAGIGLDALVFIAVNALWPGAFLEYELGPLVLRADLGGGLVWVFGLETASSLETKVIPQIDLSLKLTDWMRVGVGVLAFEAGPALVGHAVAYVGLRFTLIDKA